MDFSKMTTEELKEYQQQISEDKKLLVEAIAIIEKEYKECDFYIRQQCDHDYQYVDSYESWCTKCGDVWHR